MPRKKSGEFDNKLYQNEYHKAMKTKLISFNPNSPEDMRLWDYLQTKDNQTGYIKKLIRENMNKEDNNMKYEVDYYDPANRSTSPIDTIDAPEGYTAEQYIADCRDNADPEYVEMLERGEVTLIAISE